MPSSSVEVHRKFQSVESLQLKNIYVPFITVNLPVSKNNGYPAKLCGDYFTLYLHEYILLTSVLEKAEGKEPRDIHAGQKFGVCTFYLIRPLSRISLQNRLALEEFIDFFSM